MGQKKVAQVLPIYNRMITRREILTPYTNTDKWSSKNSLQVPTSRLRTRTGLDTVSLSKAAERVH